MKTILTFLLSCLIVWQSNAQTTNINSKIERVTVFLSGAQVVRKGNAALVKGRNELVFKGLSPFLDKESIRIKGSSNFSVLSVNFTVNYLEEQTKRGEVERLVKQQKDLQRLMDIEIIQNSVLQKENTSLERNDVVSSVQTGVKTADLKELMTYRTAQLRENTLKIYEGNVKLAAWREEFAKIDAQINTINGKAATATGDITIVANGETTGNTEVEIDYLVSNASWYMSYDLRVKDVSSPMNLLYKANITQQSGEDWKDVKLTFCTGNPTNNNTPPILQPWYLRDAKSLVLIPAEYETDSKSKAAANPTTKWVKKRGDANCLSQNPDDCMVWCLVEVPAQYQTVTNSRMKKPARLGYKKDAEDGKSTTEYIEIANNITSTLYEVTLPYTVLNDGKYYSADIKNATIPTSYEYYTAPKLSTDAFLTALVANWDELQLLKGDASLYYEGSFMGKTTLNPDNTKDTLRISLGIDKGITVQRVKLKEYAKKQFFGDKQTDERAFEIAIRNRKPQAITIIVEDQIPISTQKEISVEYTTLKDVKYDENTGKLTWHQTIEASKERKFVLQYKVKSPKGQGLIVE